MSAPLDAPRMTAGINLLGRTGATDFQIRYCDEEKPTVWIAVVTYGDRWETAAASDPIEAVSRLCRQVIDGGECVHCHKPTGLDDDAHADPLNDAVSDLICWYRFDPELATYRRSCEGVSG